MIFRFDFTRLERFQKESLQKILDVIQSENKREIIVEAVKLPYVFLVLADKTVELLCSSESEKKDYLACLNINRKLIRSISRKLKRNRFRNRNYRMPVKAAQFVQAGRRRDQQI